VELEIREWNVEFGEAEEICSMFGLDLWRLKCQEVRERWFQRCEFWLFESEKRWK
jgi:hypothetical protein